MEKVIGSAQSGTDQQQGCYHCGEAFQDQVIHFDHHDFCCDGCVTVYDLLKENDLCRYYTIDGPQGISPDKTYFEGKFDYLDLSEVQGKMLEFTDGNLSRVNWLLPKMHCSSCIWLLEQLGRLHTGIRDSTVNFPEKKVRITFDPRQVKLSELAALLTRIGYEPYLSLDDLEGRHLQKWNRQRLYKIGISGFAFGNIMMLSFPEYFHLGNTQTDGELRILFSALNIALALPVYFYCASDFFKSAWAALRERYLNIEAPIVLALTSIFLTSLYQILSGTGPGYLDSLTGAVFFMLVGRYFQDKTYAGITFDRDYKSYFPVAVTVISDQKEQRVPITDLKPGDRILVRSQELIPADSCLLSAQALIDYSFVSGESVPVEKHLGETLYAGGKQTGPAIELEVLRKVSQSYLTQLWNNDTFEKQKEAAEQTLASRINRYFSSIVFLIALGSFVVWFFVLKNQETAFQAFTTVLLVACPCALVLSSTFTNGNLVSLFGKHRFYPKNSHAIERLSHIDTVVFDKTGTITLANEAEVDYTGRELNEQELIIVKTLATQSGHPLSRLLAQKLSVKASKRVLTDFAEIEGSGMRAFWGNREVKLGSAAWVGAEHEDLPATDASRVFFSIQNEICGYFNIKSKYRDELPETIRTLQQAGLKTYLLSGDKPTDQEQLSAWFGESKQLFFNQTPELKLHFIRRLQEDGRKVLMVGDGLNDAGALRQSDVGLAVSDDINNFSPSCDAIVDGRRLTMLPGYIKLAKAGQSIIKASFVISLFYNVFGLSFAIFGKMSPVIAAILMPVSTITIVGFTTLASNIAAKRLIKK